jgi:ABC-2 type transport system permease protein
MSVPLLTWGEIHRREWKRIISDRLYFFLALIAPLLALLIIGNVYKQAVIRHEPVAVIDADNSDLSRKLVAYLNAEEKFQMRSDYHSLKRAERDFRAGKVHGIIYIPRKFSGLLKSGMASPVKLWFDGHNIIYGYNLKGVAVTAIMTFSKEVQAAYFMAKGSNTGEAMARIMPLVVDYEPLYNPYLNYAYYLAPGAILGVWQILVVFLGGLFRNAELASGKWPELKETARNHPFRLLFAKLAPYFEIFLFWGAVYTVFLFGLLQLPLGANLRIFFLLYAAWLAISLLAGALISTWLDNSGMAGDVIAVLFASAFVLSGLTWPMEAMPSLLKQIALTFPLTWLVRDLSVLFSAETVGIAPFADNFAVYLFYGISLTSLTALILRRKERLKNV